MTRKARERPAEDVLTLAEVGRLCLSVDDAEGRRIFEKLKRSEQGIARQLAELEQIARDAGIWDGSDWEFEASRLHLFLEALVSAEDWEDPMEVLGADPELGAEEGFVDWHALWSLAEARARRSEDGGAGYEAVAGKLSARGEAWREDMELHRETQRRLETTLGELFEWCSSRGTLPALRRHLAFLSRKVEETLELEGGSKGAVSLGITIRPKKTKPQSRLFETA